MKKLMVIASMLFIFAGVSQAQELKPSKGNKHAMHRKHNMHHKGWGKLNLTENQKQQTKTLNESYKQQITDLRSNKTISETEAKQRINAIRKEHKEKMMNILTAEQKNQLEQIRKEHKEKEIAKRAEHFKQMQTKLGLNADQVSRLKTQQTEFKSKMQAVKNNNSLTQDQKKEQFKTLAQEHKQQRETILTAEQKTKMEEWKKNRQSRK